jgi:hypothetical protein
MNYDRTDHRQARIDIFTYKELKGNMREITVEVSVVVQKISRKTMN